MELSVRDGLSAARELWGELLPHSSRATAFASWDWADAWWRHFRAWPTPFGAEAPKPRLLVLAVFDAQGQPIGLAPLVRLTEPGPLGRRDLRLLGDFGEAGCGFSEEPILLLRRGCEEQAVRAILRHFTQQRRGSRWDVISLQFPLPEDSDLASASGSASDPGDVGSLMEAVGWGGACSKLHKSERTSLQTVALPASWGEFRAELSKSMRDNLAYYPRLLDRRGHSWSVRALSEPGEVAAAVGNLVDLHRQRARSARGPRHTNYLPLPEHRRLLEAALPRLAAQGAATIYELEIEGATAASLATVQSESEVTIYISGFDPRWYDYSPLLILTAHTLRRSIESGKSRANFMCGAMPSKARWGATDGPAIQRLTYVRPSAESLGRIALHTWRQRTEAAEAREMSAQA